MVVGRSGSGKSSLVNAGLVPALRAERDRFWDVLHLRPGPEPLRALAAAFNPRAESEGAAAFANRMNREVEELRKDVPKLLADMIGDFLEHAEGKPDRLLLHADQWEELYAQASGRGDGEHGTNVKRFIDLLLNATQSAPVSIVGTLRADFYDPLIAHPGINALLPHQQVLLGGMRPSELGQTVVEPAKLVGLRFDPPSLVQRILDEAGEDEGMLPLLEYALKETWTQREGKALTTVSYERSGGVRTAIRKTGDRTFEFAFFRRSTGGAAVVFAVGNAGREPGGYKGACFYAHGTRPTQHCRAFCRTADATIGDWIRPWRAPHGGGCARGADPHMAKAARTDRRQPRKIARAGSDPASQG